MIAKHAYWINDSSPSGYLTEKLLPVSFLPQGKAFAKKQLIQGEEICYIDWLFPLTHMLKAIRKVKNEGAGILDVQTKCFFMIVFTIIGLATVAWLLSWNE